jgi:MoxR-like ATPase
LLEAMSDYQVSIDGQTYPLARPFMVIATQNPFEFEGTYLLPESQLDRFLLRISMGYPDRKFETDIFQNHRHGEPVDRLEPVCDGQQLLAIQSAVSDVKVDASITEYMLDIIHLTRETPELSYGVSTRGGLAWYRAVQASAMMDQRDYAIPDDARDLAIPVLSHRVQQRGVVHGGKRSDLESILREIVSRVPIPD